MYKLRKLAAKVFNVLCWSDDEKAVQCVRDYLAHPKVDLKKFVDVAVTLVLEMRGTVEEVKNNLPDNDFSYKLVLLKCFRNMAVPFRQERERMLDLTNTLLQREPNRKYADVRKLYESPGVHSVPKTFTLLPLAKLKSAFVQIDQSTIRNIAKKVTSKGVRRGRTVPWNVLGRYFIIHDFKRKQDRRRGKDPQATGRTKGPRPYQKVLSLPRKVDQGWRQGKRDAELLLNKDEESFYRMLHDEVGPISEIPGHMKSNGFACHLSVKHDRKCGKCPRTPLLVSYRVWMVWWSTK